LADESLEFSTTVGTPQTLRFGVLSEGLTEDITATLTDANNVFSLASTTISRTDSENNGVYVDVTFSPTVAGTFTATVTLSSAGADDVTVVLSGTAADGYSSGQMIQAIRETAAEQLPEGYGYEFGGMTREEASSQNTTALVFVICIIFIYLILCALYESLFIPLAVILSVPFGLAGSFIFAHLWGLENNIYMQTGLIMLIGLLSKTAILLTEYASARRRQGMGIVAAALDAAAVRLRPILMTSLTMVFGLLPLALATGVGANGNRSLGVGAIGGMLIGTVALLFIVPCLFVIFQTIEERLKHVLRKKTV
jgi:multidrug efflux pump subunit AcrB